ncbi:MAG: hypothetical protein ACYS21_02155, partial [Planctomycetota bacterium]
MTVSHLILRSYNKIFEKIEKIDFFLLTEWEEVVRFPNVVIISGANAMLLLTGEYEHIVDDKS